MHKLLLYLIFVIFLDACESFSCFPPVISNSRLRRFRSNFYKVTCRRGFKLYGGSSYIRCSNGQFEEPLPICVQNSGNCKEEEVPNSIKISEHKGAVIQYFCMIGYKLVGSSVIFCDGKGWNDTAPHCKAIDEPEPAALSCDFEKEDLCGWRHDEQHDFNWIRLNRKTPSSFLKTGPSFDHTYGEGKSGYYMYIESTSRDPDNKARLISPVYNSSLVDDGCFSFYYHMYGLATGGLKIYQIPTIVTMSKLFDGDDDLTMKSTYLLFDKWYNQGDQWLNAKVPLLKIKTDFQIVIEGIRGHSFTSDIAVDDVAILQGESCKFTEISTTPVTLFADSCSQRCNINTTHRLEINCECVFSCFETETCCTDYFEVCFSDIFFTRNTPINQKLVASTEMDRQSTSTAAPTTPIRITTPTTQQSVLTSLRTTQSHNVSKVTTKKIPSSAVTLPIVATIITPTPNKTLISKKTTVPTQEAKISSTNTPSTKIRISDKVILTTQKSKIVTGVENVVTSTKEPINRTVNITKSTESPIPNITESIKNISKNEALTSKHSSKGTSNITIILLIAGTIFCLPVLTWLILTKTTNGKRMMLRMKGQMRHDSEVRYLTSNVDPED